jgi:hypothetical protein
MASKDPLAEVGGFCHHHAACVPACACALGHRQAPQGASNVVFEGIQANGGGME